MNVHENEIERVRAGDSLKSFDNHGNIGTSTVEKVLSIKAKDLVTMTTATSTITGTAAHPFFTDSPERQNKKYPGYRNLVDFVQGDTVKTIGDGTTLSSATITSVAKTKKAETKVYNLHIGKGSPTCFANGFAVHNK